MRLYANTCSGYIYQWKKDGVNISGATGDSYLATTGGSYQVKIVQGSSASWSALTNVTVNNCSQNAMQSNEDSLNIKKPTLQAVDAFKIMVYPNPTTGAFSFDFCLEEVEEDEMEINIFNSAGVLVYNRPPVKVSGCLRETIELTNSLNTGVYILQTRLGLKVESTKLVLNR